LHRAIARSKSTKSFSKQQVRFCITIEPLPLAFLSFSISCRLPLAPAASTAIPYKADSFLFAVARLAIWRQVAVSGFEGSGGLERLRRRLKRMLTRGLIIAMRCRITARSRHVLDLFSVARNINYAVYWRRHHFFQRPLIGSRVNSPPPPRDVELLSIFYKSSTRPIRQKIPIREVEERYSKCII